MKKCKLDKILLIKLEVWKLNKQLSNQSFSFQKSIKFFQLSKFKWFCARNCLPFFSIDKGISTCSLFGHILEEQLIIKVQEVFNYQQQYINIIAYLKNSLFSDAIGI